MSVTMTASRSGRTVVLATLAVVTLGLGCWWWVANEPPAGRASPVARATDAVRSAAIGVIPGNGVALRPDPDRRRDLRPDAWQLLPKRPNTLGAVAEVVAEQQTLSLNVTGVPGERYLIEWFCLGTGEVQLWRDDDRPEVVNCAPSGTALAATAPRGGRVRFNIRWISPVAAVIGIQVSMP